MHPIISLYTVWFQWRSYECTTVQYGTVDILLRETAESDICLGPFKLYIFNISTYPAMPTVSLIPIRTLHQGPTFAKSYYLNCLFYSCSQTFCPRSDKHISGSCCKDTIVCRRLVCQIYSPAVLDPFLAPKIYINYS